MARNSGKNRRIGRSILATIVLICSLAVILPAISGCSLFRKTKKSATETTQKEKTEASSKKGTKAEEGIAFIKDGDIWTMKPDGSEKKQLTKTKNYEFSLSFSEKGKRIWFIRTTDGEQQEVSAGEVWSMKIDGSDAKRITTGQTKIGFAAVSPNGQKIGVSLIKSVPEIYPGGPAGETADVWIMDANASEQTEASSHTALSDDLAPQGDEMGREGSTFCSWSPDSKKIAFTFKADQSGSLGISTRKVYIANNNGSDRKEIGGGMDHPVFSPDGKYIAAERGEHWDTIGLKAITTSGEDYKEIVPVPTGELYSVSTPAWINNNNVTYPLTTHPAKTDESTTTLYSANLETLAKTEIVTQSKVKGTITNPKVNFDEKKIVFEVEHLSAQGGETTSDVWTVNADGSDSSKISAGSADAGPIWVKK